MVNKAQRCARCTADFNFGWRFARGEQPDAQAVDFDDSAWRDVRLPHDWSVEESFTQENTGGSTAFLPGGIGWYRKTFSLPAENVDRFTWVEFDGVYSNSEVWINGHYLGKRPYGYTCFSYDLTPYLHYGDIRNVIAVKADRSSYIDCRWYPGSGIYRNVRLVTVNPVHIPQFGVFVTTPLATTEQAQVAVQTTVANRVDHAKTVTLCTTLLDAEGAQVGVQEDTCTLDAGQECEIAQQMDLTHPRLWDTESPNMYSIVSTLLDEGAPCDEVKTPFGIRDIRYDPETGFYLNGKNTLFKGVCLHHDGGCVGAAVPIGVWKRRLRILKAAGCNAIRTSHNPPAAEFLDLCDQMGFLVQDEAFDEWTNPKDKRHNHNQRADEAVTRGYTHHFIEWGEADVKAMVLRDRNHPSIVMWSIGNEVEWTYPRYREAAGYWEEGKEDVDYYYDLPPYDVPTMKERFQATDPGPYEMAPIAQSLSRWIKEVDTTRPVTANLVLPSVGHWSGLTDPLDIVGYSYRRVIYEYGHERYPDKMIFGSENWCQWHEWKPVLEQPFNPGIFLWTGINYLGESRNWPTKASGSGLLDLAGFKNPRYHMFRSLWNDAPYVYAATSLSGEASPYEVVEGEVVYRNRDEKWMPFWGWQEVNEHWNYASGDEVYVEVYTNCPEVELFLNGVSLGIKKLADYDDHICKWPVPYAEGQIEAVGYALGTTARCELATAQAPARVALAIDKHTLVADRYDVVHVEAQLCDAAGVPVRTEEREITFEIAGPHRLLGVDNGSTQSVQDYQSNCCTTYLGRCLLVLQATGEAGEITVTAQAEGLSEKTTRTVTNA